MVDTQEIKRENNWEAEDENCPVCGYCLGSDTLIETSEPMSTGDPELPFGARNWAEIHRCQCGQVVKVYQQNY